MTEPIPSGGDWVKSPPIFHDGFENAERLEDLGPDDLSRWHGGQNEPDGANLVELSSEQVHTGEQALKFVAQPTVGNAVSKADVFHSGLSFVNGDEVWVEVWYYIVGGTDTSSLFLWDLEAPGTCLLFDCQSPGRRLYFTGPDGDWLKSDMGKWWRGKDFRQASGEEIPFPKDRWVRLRVYLILSPGADGVMKVWQGNDLVLDAAGRTLPNADALYTRLQVGITANGNESDINTIYLDDVTIWDSDPNWE